MDKVVRTLYPLILLCLALLLMVGCTAYSTVPPVTNGGELSPYQPDTSLGPADRVDVVYFHRTQRCPTCLYAEEQTQYTLETYFADELASGKLTFQVLNVEDKANADIVKKYNASYLTLAINTVKDGTDHIKKVTSIWTAVDNDKAFTEIVKSEIEKSLKGEV